MTLYAIRPDPQTGSIDDDSEVLFESPLGWEFLEQAVTLWRLVNGARAAELQAALDHISQTNPDAELRIESSGLDELVRLLDGVDDAIVAAGIVDHQWRVQPDRLEALAAAVPAMDLKTERPIQAKTSALGEIMINAVSIRNFLSKAIEAGCLVVLG